MKSKLAMLMYHSLVDLEIGEREVFVRRPHGQDQMPSDYKLTEKEIKNGSWDHIPYVLRFNGNVVMSLGHYPSNSHHGVRWATNCGIEQGVDVIRHSYIELRRDYRVLRNREMPQNEPEEYRGVTLSGVPGINWSHEGFPVEFFLNKAEFEKLIHQNIIDDKGLIVRVGSGYADLWFHYKESMTEQNIFAVTAHRNLIRFLPEYIRRTHERSLPDIAIEAIRQLSTGIMNDYEPLVTK